MKPLFGSSLDLRRAVRYLDIPQRLCPCVVYVCNLCFHIVEYYSAKVHTFSETAKNILSDTIFRMEGPSLKG